MTIIDVFKTNEDGMLIVPIGRKDKSGKVYEGIIEIEDFKKMFNDFYMKSTPLSLEEFNELKLSSSNMWKENWEELADELLN